jgi:hypothetical protein
VRVASNDLETLANVAFKTAGGAGAVATWFRSRNYWGPCVLLCGAGSSACRVGSQADAWSGSRYHSLSRHECRDGSLRGCATNSLRSAG